MNDVEVVDCVVSNKRRASLFSSKIFKILMVSLWVSYNVTAYHNKQLGNHGTCCFIQGFVISMTLDIRENFISSIKISAPKYLLKSFLRFFTEEFSQNSFMIYKTFYIYYLRILKGIKKTANTTQWWLSQGSRTKDSVHSKWVQGCLQ